MIINQREERHIARLIQHLFSVGSEEELLDVLLPDLCRIFHADGCRLFLKVPGGEERETFALNLTPCVRHPSGDRRSFPLEAEGLRQGCIVLSRKDGAPQFSPEEVKKMAFLLSYFPYALAHLKREGGIGDRMTVSTSPTVPPYEVDTSILSMREKQVVAGLMEGWNNNQIARALGITENTVKTHFYSIFNKTGVDSRAQLLHLLLRGGL